MLICRNDGARCGEWAAQHTGTIGRDCAARVNDIELKGREANMWPTKRSQFAVDQLAVGTTDTANDTTATMSVADSVSRGRAIGYRRSRRLQEQAGFPAPFQGAIGQHGYVTGSQQGLQQVSRCVGVIDQQLQLGQGVGIDR